MQRCRQGLFRIRKHGQHPLFNDGDRYVFNAHYSPSAFYAIGYNAEYWRDEKFQLHALHLNNLLKRWNGEGSQANFYLQSGIDAAHYNEWWFSNIF